MPIREDPCPTMNQKKRGNFSLLLYACPFGHFFVTKTDYFCQIVMGKSATTSGTGGMSKAPKRGLNLLGFQTGLRYMPNMSGLYSDSCFLPLLSADALWRTDLRPSDFLTFLTSDLLNSDLRPLTSESSLLFSLSYFLIPDLLTFSPSRPCCPFSLCLPARRLFGGTKLL